MYKRKLTTRTNSTKSRKSNSSLRYNNTGRTSLTSRFNAKRAIIVASLLVAIGFIFFSARASGSAVFNLSPTNGSFEKGSIATIGVFEYSNDQINTVNVDLIYDTTKLQFISIDTNSSTFDYALTATGGNGHVTIARGISNGGTVNGMQRIGTVSFRVLTGSDVTSIAYGPGTAIVRPSDGMNVWNNGSTLAGTYTLTNPPGSASFSLAPATGSYEVGKNLAVTINESSTDQINSVNANLTYDPAKLQFVSVDAANSTFNYAISATGGNGIVAIARGVSSGGTVSGNQTVALVNFKVLANSGSSIIRFGPGTAIVRPIDGTNVWNNKTDGGSYSFTTPVVTAAPNVPPTISITSPTANTTLPGDSSYPFNVTAADADGSIAKVEFYNGTTKLGEDATSPYTFSLFKLPGSSATLKAIAYDNLGLTTSATVNVTISSTVTPTPVPPTTPVGPPSVSKSLNYDYLKGRYYIYLSWPAATGTVTSYEVRKNNIIISTTASNVTKLKDYGLSPNANYSYQVIAINGNYRSAGSSIRPVSVICFLIFCGLQQ